MHPAITEWAARYCIPDSVLSELNVALIRSSLPAVVSATHASEAAVQQRVRFGAASAGWLLWRNNVGAMYDADGRFVRYGLCNDSEKLNEQLKSHDLIGIRPVLIGPEHLGSVIGQFVSRECKAGNWRYTGTPREKAQMAFATLVNNLGGDAKFTTGSLT